MNSKHLALCKHGNRIAAVAILLANCCFAQDPFAQPAGGNPFDAGANPFGNVPASPFGGAPAANAGAGAAPTLETSDPLVVELRRLAQGNFQQLAKAIRSAIQIEDWPEAGAFVDILASKAPNDADYASIASTIKPHYLLRLQQQGTLTDQQRATLLNVIDGAKRYAEDRSILKQHIPRLDSPDAPARLAAVSALRKGGHAAIAELAAAFVAENPSASPDSILEMLKRFGNVAFEAMQPFALYGSPSIKPKALTALSGMDVHAATPDLVSGYHAQDATTQERKAAAAGLAKTLRAMPTKAEADIYLERAVDQLTSFAQATPRTDTFKTIWQLAEDQQSLDWYLVPTKVAHSRRAAEAGFRYLRLDAATRSGSVDAMIADFDYTLMANPAHGTEADLRARFGDVKDIAKLRTLLGRVVQKSLDTGHELAAITAIRLLSHLKSDQLVASEGATRALLVLCTSHESARLRYEAAIAVERQNYDIGYSGSSQVLHSWIEMTKLKERPTALILDARVHMTGNYLHWLESLGFAVERIPTVRQLLLRIDRGDDIQLVMSTSQPADRQMVETVDLIRRHQSGGSIPLVIYCQPERTLWDEDLRQPVVSAAGIVISDVAKREATEATDAIDDLNGPPPEPLMIRVENGGNLRLDAIRRRYAVSREKIRLEQAIGDRWSGPLAVAERIDSVYDLAVLIKDLTAQLPTTPLTGMEREQYAAAGTAILERIGNSEPLQNVYDLWSHEAEIIAAVRQGGFSETGLSLLSQLGTRQSQTLLANLAATSSLPQTTRQQAAVAFASSIERFGTRLDRDDVVLQYDRFNAAADQANQAVLGTLLDAMEQRVQSTSR